jgi:hypothetical protein
MAASVGLVYGSILVGLSENTLKEFESMAQT